MCQWVKTLDICMGREKGEDSLCQQNMEIYLGLFSFPDILQGNFKPDFYLKYIQKDLRLAIALGDSVNHPTPMAAAANEVREAWTHQCVVSWP